MNTEFTIEELNNIHLALIAKERVLRENWIPHEKSFAKKESLTQEANRLRTLCMKVCAAQLSKELGFEIKPVVDR